MQLHQYFNQMNDNNDVKTTLSVVINFSTTDEINTPHASTQETSTLHIAIFKNKHEK